ncbi:MAG: serine/threonine protein kinase, partial [Microcystis panniformis]
GIIAIQALTGLKPTQFPEDAETGEIAWRNHVDVRDDLAAIIDKMTRYDWRQRFPSAAEVLDAIKDLRQLRQQKALVPEISAEQLFYRGNAHLDLGQNYEAVQLYQ